MQHDPYDVHILNPNAVRFQHNRGGLLTATIDGCLYEGVTLTRSFPLTKPDEYLAVTTADGKELGILETIDGLDADSRAAVAQELRVRYLVPVITRVESIRQEPGLWTWEVQTDRGPMTLLMRNLHEHVQDVGRNRKLLTDMHGRRCELRDITQLDAHSQRQLKKVT